MHRRKASFKIIQKSKRGKAAPAFTKVYSRVMAQGHLARLTRHFAARFTPVPDGSSRGIHRLARLARHISTSFTPARINSSASAEAKVPSMRLRDGRTLSWREDGDPSGFPVLFMHGNLNSSKFQPAWEKTTEQARAARARVIFIDRPGVGWSSVHEDRTYESFARDVGELMTHLGLSSVAVCGFSSGTRCAIL